MPYGRVDYPEEMVTAAQKISAAAGEIDAVMKNLKVDQIALLEQSSGAHAGAFAEVQHAWERSGLANAQKFAALANAVKDAKLSMDEWDLVASNKFRS